MINSDAYWNNRFDDDWGALQGPAQSRFFARIAIENLPRWLIEQLQRQNLTLCDWGCAQGDGTDVWASYIDSERLTGVDFSSVAIEQAAQRYPAIKFLNENWLNNQVNKDSEFDIVFSSNAIEHFHKPYDVLEVLCNRATKAVVIVIPYRELDRYHEHFYTFLPENIPSKIGNGFRMVWSRVIDCRHLPNTYWSGEQIILVFAKSDWLDDLGLTLHDLLIEQTDHASEIATLNQAVTDRDRQIASLNQAVADRDRQIASLNQTVVNCDIEIYKLNNEIMNIKQSNSWGLTSPLRSIKDLVVAPRRTTYLVIRKLFWSLPSGLRQALHGPRHLFVRYARGLSAIKPQKLDNSNNSDLTWKEFNETVLAKRADYKGVFVQELTIDWSVPLYQRPQHISVALGRLGYLVIYRTENWVADNVNGFREVAVNVWITNSPEIEKIHNVVRSIYSTAYLHTPDLIIKNGRRGRIVYEYIDHIDQEISGDDENIKRLLALKKFAFEGGVDFVIASAKKLYDEAVSIVGKEKVILVPNGVDTRHYRSTTHVNTNVPQSLIDFKERHKAIVGYFGAIAPWLWYEVMSELAVMRPDFGFVFIGTDYYGGVEKLPKFENVLYMGAIDYKDLPAYARQFDICFIPFKPGDIAKTTSPLKLFEYFALEKPVVVTSDMDECTVFDEVFSGGSALDLSHAFDLALQVKDSKEFMSKLRALADQNDWIERARTLEVCFKGLENE